MRLAMLLPLVAGLGCAAAAGRPLEWHDDLAAAQREATASGRPLVVISIVGDLRKRC